jgi:predicted RNA polymerase sigma factor
MNYVTSTSTESRFYVQSGLDFRLIDASLAREELASHHLAHSDRADLCRRLGRMAEARDSYEKALALVRCEPERQFLAGRLRELQYKKWLWLSIFPVPGRL